MDHNWKYIPGFTSYTINREGVVRNPSKQVLEPAIDANGQPFYRLVDGKKRVEMTPAELLETAFGEIPAEAKQDEIETGGGGSDKQPDPNAGDGKAADPKAKADPKATGK